MKKGAEDFIWVFLCRRASAVVALVVVLVLASLAGCGGTAPDATPPGIESTTPAANATNVVVDQTVSILFSEKVNVDTLSAKLYRGVDEIPAIITKGIDSVQISPERPMDFDSSYKLVIGKGLADLSGNIMPQDYTLDFSTGTPNTSFIKGGVISDSFIRKTWGDSSFWPLQQLHDAGMNLVRVGVTTQSYSELSTAAPSTWSSIPYQAGFWSCREVAGEILKEAGAMGYKLDAFLFLSDEAANAAQQYLPEAWSGLSVSEIESRVRQSAADTADYFKNALGLNIDVYEIGNEIDFGMLGYFVGDGIPQPSGIDFVNQSGWLENNVWNIEAGFLKAAIQGIKSVSPDAKIGLHIAGFGYSSGNNVVGRFFTYMKDNGVDFDIAELSYPYMFGQSAVPQPYFRQAEFIQALDALKAMGKTVYIAEFSYPAASNGIDASPSEVYPYTDAGQDGFLEDFFKVVQEHADGTFYFYPDYYPGCAGDQPALESSGLFSSATSARPGLSQFGASSP